MRIGSMFNEPIQSNSTRSSHSKTKLRKKSTKKEAAFEVKTKKQYSAADIRAKVESLKNPKAKEIKTTSKTNENDVDVEPQSVDSQEKVIIGDIKSNSPEDPMVREKLRAILKSGAFSFNDKTQGILSGILGKSED